MNASKENCQHAIDNLTGQERFMNEYAYKTILAFLQAALKKLPSESAFAKEKSRKHKK